MEENCIEISGPTNICTIIGVDTVLGQHLAKLLVTSGRMVYGFTQDEEFKLEAEPSFVDGDGNSPYPPAPVISDWLVICLEPCRGFEKYTSAVQRMCEHIQESEYCGKVCLLSSSAICLSNNVPIHEGSAICTRTEQELCLATAENILNVMLHKTGNEAETCVLRLPSLYGGDGTLPSSFGFIDAQIQKARTSGVVDYSIFYDVKRTLLHIDEACQAIIRLLEVEHGPALVNIPGEVVSLEEIVTTIAEKYHASTRKFCPEQDEPFFFAEDLAVDGDLFNSTIDFTRKVSFPQWLMQQDPK